MVHRADALSSTTEAFDQECTRLRDIFTRLDYPIHFINSTINKIVQNIEIHEIGRNIEDGSAIRISLPSKDQTSANAVRRQMRDLSHKFGTTLQKVFLSKKIEQDLKPNLEIEPQIVNQLFVVYQFKCNPCDADYVGYTAGNLHQRIVEHKHSATGKHFMH